MRSRNGYQARMTFQGWIREPERCARRPSRCSRREPNKLNSSTLVRRSAQLSVGYRNNEEHRLWSRPRLGSRPCKPNIHRAWVTCALRVCLITLQIQRAERNQLNGRKERWGVEDGTNSQAVDNDNVLLVAPKYQRLDFPEIRST